VWRCQTTCVFVQACAFEHCLSAAALAWIQGLIKSTNMFFLLSLNSILSILLTLKHTWLHSTCTQNQSTKETTCPTIPTCIGWRSCVLLLVLSNPIKLPVVHFGGRSGRNCRDAYWKRVSWKWKGFLCIHIDVTAWQLQERDSCSKQKLFHRIFVHPPWQFIRVPGISNENLAMRYVSNAPSGLIQSSGIKRFP